MSSGILLLNPYLPVDFNPVLEAMEKLGFQAEDFCMHSLEPDEDEVKIDPSNPKRGDCYYVKDNRPLIVLGVSYNVNSEMEMVRVTLYGEIKEVPVTDFRLWLASLYAAPNFRLQL